MAIRQALIPIVGTGQLGNLFRPKYLDGLRYRVSHYRNTAQPFAIVTVDLTAAQETALSNRNDVVMIPQSTDDAPILVTAALRTAVQALGIVPTRAARWDGLRRDLLFAATLSQMAYGARMTLFSNATSLSDPFTEAMRQEWITRVNIAPLAGTHTIGEVLYDALDSLPSRYTQGLREQAVV